MSAGHKWKIAWGVTTANFAIGRLTSELAKDMFLLSREGARIAIDVQALLADHKGIRMLSV